MKNILRNNIQIDPLSYVALHIEAYFNDTPLGSATGFLVVNKNKKYLITNWHVVSGRDPITDAPLDIKTSGIPNKLHVWMQKNNKDLHMWLGIKLSLTRDDKKLWKEHPMGREVDVVAIPVEEMSLIEYHPLDLSLMNTNLYISPSETASIIGFPFGRPSYGKFPIWKTGHIASDIDFDYEEKPAFLIDATTKPGMSGSPVIARREGLYRPTKDLTTVGEATRFLGIYSGRIHGDSDIGIVWKPEVINEILGS